MYREAAGSLLTGLQFPSMIHFMPPCSKASGIFANPRFRAKDTQRSSRSRSAGVGTQNLVMTRSLAWPGYGGTRGQEAYQRLPKQRANYKKNEVSWEKLCPMTSAALSIPEIQRWIG